MFKEKSYGIYETKTKNFTIRYTAMDSQEPWDSLTQHMEEELVEDLKYKVESGEIICFDVLIEVVFYNKNDDIEEILGSSALGGCFYSSFEDFIDYVGIGYTASKNKLKKDPNDYFSKEVVKSFETNGNNKFGSQFRSLVTESINEAKSTDFFKEFNNILKIKNKIKSF